MQRTLSNIDTLSDRLIKLSKAEFPDLVNLCISTAASVLERHEIQVRIVKARGEMFRTPQYCYYHGDEGTNIFHFTVSSVSPFTLADDFVFSFDSEGCQCGYPSRYRHRGIQDEDYEIFKKLTACLEALSTVQ